MPNSPKVLVIEDDKFVSKAMIIKFEEKNFVVKAVFLAEEGIKLLKTWLPDVIILDLVLPGIDGYEFIKKAKASPKWKNIPIIVASNLEKNEKAQQATDYIVKSDLDLDELVKRALLNIKQ